MEVCGVRRYVSLEIVKYACISSGMRYFLTGMDCIEKNNKLLVQYVIILIIEVKGYAWLKPYFSTASLCDYCSRIVLYKGS